MLGWSRARLDNLEIIPGIEPRIVQPTLRIQVTVQETFPSLRCADSLAGATPQSAAFVCGDQPPAGRYKTTAPEDTSCFGCDLLTSAIKWQAVCAITCLTAQPGGQYMYRHYGSHYMYRQFGGQYKYRQVGGHYMYRQFGGH
jgi:hypothetical protein